MLRKIKMGDRGPHPPSCIILTFFLHLVIRTCIQPHTTTLSYMWVLFFVQNIFCLPLSKRGFYHFIYQCHSSVVVHLPSSEHYCSGSTLQQTIPQHLMGTYNGLDAIFFLFSVYNLRMSVTLQQWCGQTSRQESVWINLGRQD